jgi:predicted metal-dependent hydrolase
MPDDLALSPADALAEAQRLLDADRPFHAHEVLESVWKAAPEEERELWRGLAQLAVGLTHVRRGNARGARSLLSRGADRLVAFAGAPPHGLDLDAVVRDVRALTARLEAEDLRTDMELGVRLVRSR